ncbi:MAG: glycosyltransferase family 2 protein [Rhodospirillales bacterium]|nr:glycosyltransferase family 2 protein [Rhodospirillales bacterium]
MFHAHPPQGGYARVPPEVSVVIPFYNEVGNVERLFDRLVPVLNGCTAAWEVVCVNDGSRDDTLARLICAHHADPRIKVIDLSRNFGKEAALSAGLAAAAGRAVIPMDADLQHPPEAIPAMIAKWREGFEVVLAVRENRSDQDIFGRCAARAFYWIFERLSDVKLPAEVGDFRLMDRKVVAVINRMPERNRFMKGIFAWVGFRQTGIPYRCPPRVEGESKWAKLRLFRFAFSGLTAFSNFPLRVWGLIGATISALAFAYIVYRLARTLVYGVDVPGYESIIVTILFLGGVQLLSLGIIGDYLGRVFEEAKGRPLYVVREVFAETDPVDHRAGVET